MSATATDGGSGVISVAFDARPSSGGSWTSICSDGSAPYSCAWNTTAVAEGAWDVRATTTDGAGNTSSSTTANRIVDNTAPTITLTDPGTPLGGTVALGSTTGDGAGSGVSSVLYQYRANGSTGAWSTACTGASAPFSCTGPTPADRLLRPARDRHRRRQPAPRPRPRSSPARGQHDPQRGGDEQPRHARCAAPSPSTAPAPTRTRAWPRCASSTSSAPAARGAPRAPT